MPVHLIGLDYDYDGSKKKNFGGAPPSDATDTVRQGIYSGLDWKRLIALSIKDRCFLVRIASSRDIEGVGSLY